MYLSSMCLLNLASQDVTAVDINILEIISKKTNDKIRNVLSN